jgi:hypothetical protein
VIRISRKNLINEKEKKHSKEDFTRAFSKNSANKRRYLFGLRRKTHEIDFEDKSCCVLLG